MFEKKLQELGFSKPTPIQKELFKAFGKSDILAKAPTGSGKSLSFLIPLSFQKENKLSTLILTPTRELAQQLEENFKKLHSSLQSALLIGGESIALQEKRLQNANIAIATPGRVLDLLNRKILTLDTIATLILDEADKMLDMGFSKEILKIISLLPQERQTLLFSATFDKKIKEFAQSILKEPIVIETEANINIDSFYSVTSNKEQSLLFALAHFNPKRAIIFCERKEDSFALYQFLQKQNIEATYINGDLKQEKRFEHLTLFKNGSKPLLVATDLASRGLDIEDIELVINFSLPLEKETFIHRRGRTARANKKGTLFSLLSHNELARLKLFDKNAKELALEAKVPKLKSDFATIKINAGKKKKIRAGDIVGTLCQKVGLESSDIGSIDIDKEFSYIAIKKEKAVEVQKKLDGAKIKKLKVKAYLL